MAEALSLLELNKLIKTVLDESLPDIFLVTAEIASCDVKNHCYLTLVDKEDDAVRAEIRAVIWANRYKAIAQVFEKATGTRLAKGMKILFQATVSYHERYGLKLTVSNIDPSYTVGELAVQRKEVLARLTKEGLINRNKELEYPLVPQRIGIISSSTAAGYEDLMNHIISNPYGYRLDCTLYEAVMQGDRAAESVVDALQKCSDDAKMLDVVVIVRGGGGQLDLHCFDSYEIGRAIALMPLPVVSGIGHQRDVTVVDEVANRRAKTPTAVADMLINNVKEFEERIDSLGYSLAQAVADLTSDCGDILSLFSKRLEVGSRNIMLSGDHALEVLSKGLKYSLKYIGNEKQQLKLYEKSVDFLNPKNVLKRGYSITYNNGKSIRSPLTVKDGDILRTVLSDGELTSTVGSVKQPQKRNKKKAGASFPAVANEPGGLYD